MRSAPEAACQNRFKAWTKGNRLTALMRVKNTENRLSGRHHPLNREKGRDWERINGHGRRPDSLYSACVRPQGKKKKGAKCPKEPDAYISS